MNYPSAKQRQLVALQYETEQVLIGKLMKRKLGRGSQKDRLVNSILMENGLDVVVRREGGTAYSDEVLDKYEGKQVKATGHMQSYVMVVSDIEEQA